MLINLKIVFPFFTQKSHASHRRQNDLSRMSLIVSSFGKLMFVIKGKNIKTAVKCDEGEDFEYYRKIKIYL
jgi:hypothetical protein